ncbi:MAG: PDZ domain-containing protein [Verrucomicrobiota bacterium]
MRALAIFLLLSAGVTASEITDAIGELGAGRFAAREAGLQQLVTLAQRDSAGVLQECARAYRQSVDPEVKARLRSVLQQVVDQYVYRAPRGFLGIRLQGGNIIIGGGGKLIINGVTVPPDAVWVTGTVEDSAAEKIGIKPNDFILAVDDKRVVTSAEFTRYVQSKRPGTKVKLQVLQGANTNMMEAVLGELPQEARDMILTEDGSREFFKTWLHDQVGGSTTNAGLGK